MGEVTGGNVRGDGWAWHSRWHGGPRLIAVLMLVAACTGCGTIGSRFTVDTGRDDPLIYAPGTRPGKDFNLSLEGVRLTCRRRTFETVFGDIELTQSPWAGRNAPARAHLSMETAVRIADATHAGAFESLVTALTPEKTGVPKCELDGGDSVSLLAAEALMRQLPRPYSAVLRDTYNHRVWNSKNVTRGISLDMSAGMRLRLENSVAIPPAGLGAVGVHPSAFAGPTFLYFHALTARELCDPGSSPRDPGHICKPDPSEPIPEDTFFLSPSGGLARLGLVQRNAVETAGTKKPPVRESSSLLDLLERHVGGGVGASKWWRLWLPAHRETKPSIRLDEGPGSPEALQTPLLLSAETLKQLQEVKFEEENPCAVPDKTAPGGNVEYEPLPTGVTCHSLHYRVMPIPEISIRVNGQREWVPVGTTLHDVIAERLHAGFASRVPYMAAELPPAHDERHAPATREVLYRAALEGVRIRRFSWHGVHDLEPRAVVDATQLARFMRLQLLPGDDITWN